MTDKEIQERAELYYSNLKTHWQQRDGFVVGYKEAAKDNCDQAKAETIERVLNLIIKYIPNQFDLDLLSDEIKQINSHDR